MIKGNKFDPELDVEDRSEVEMLRRHMEQLRILFKTEARMIPHSHEKPDGNPQEEHRQDLVSLSPRSKIPIPPLLNLPEEDKYAANRSTSSKMNSYSCDENTVTIGPLPNYNCDENDRPTPDTEIKYFCHYHASLTDEKLFPIPKKQIQSQEMEVTHENEIETPLQQVKDKLNLISQDKSTQAKESDDTQDKEASKEVDPIETDVDDVNSNAFDKTMRNVDGVTPIDSATSLTPSFSRVSLDSSYVTASHSDLSASTRDSNTSSPDLFSSPDQTNPQGLSCSTDASDVQGGASPEPASLPAPKPRPRCNRSREKKSRDAARSKCIEPGMATTYTTLKFVHLETEVSVLLGICSPRDR